MYSDKTYVLYVDDIGCGTPGVKDNFDYFGLGGIILKRNDEDAVKAAVKKFKSDWKIADEIPLHGAEIRSCKDNFRWLKHQKTEELIRFKTELLATVLEMPVFVHGCIVNRKGYHKRYLSRYSRRTWKMRKSAAAILLERSVKFVRCIGGERLDVYFEICGSKEDNIFKQAHQELKTNGHPFDPASAAKHDPLDAAVLASFLQKSPQDLTKASKLLQVADLCLYPVATSRNGKRNAPFERFAERDKLVDCHSNGDETMEIKYFCFDG